MQMQPLIMEIMQDGDSHMYHHENLSQLLYEREQHAIHKHLLEAEQVKVHELQIKLDEKESQIRALVSSSRLNAEVLNAAIQRIEPKVISMAKDLAVLNAPHRAAHHTADHEAGPGEISSGSRHDSKMSSSSPESSQLSSQGVVDQRRSLLYDIFVKLGNDGRGGWPDHHSSAAGGLRRGSQITEGEKFPDHHTSVVGGTEPSAVRQDDTHRAIVAKHLNQTVIDTTMEKASNQYDERGNDLWNLGTHADSLVPGDFSSLDQAFENDIFSKSGKGLNRPLLEEQILDNSLIEMFSEKPESTSSDHEDTMDGEKSKSRAETMENSESEQNTALGNAVAEPVLGVERVS